MDFVVQFYLFLSTFVEFVVIYFLFLYTYCGDYMDNDSLVFLFNSIIKDTRTLKVDYSRNILKK